LHFNALASLQKYVQTPYITFLSKKLPYLQGVKKDFDERDTQIRQREEQHG
jgi:hypothetical protein